MKLAVHTIKPARGSKHAPKRIGRGNASGHGTYSTRGGKGQTARAGGSHRLALKAFKRMMQSTPKLRGFKSRMEKPAEVYLSDLEKYFTAGAVVNLAALKEQKIIPARVLSAKVLFKGELKKKLVIDGVLCTKSAKAAIEKAGGEVKGKKETQE